MAQNANTTINTSLRAFLLEEKLTTQNFPFWSQKLRHVLRRENKSYVLLVPLPQEPPLTSIEAHNAWLKHNDVSINISHLMLEAMDPLLRERVEIFSYTAYEMMIKLKELHKSYVFSERLRTLQALFGTKMEEGQDVSTHIQRIRTHLDYLDELGYPYPDMLAVDVILRSLTQKIDVFINNLGRQNFSVPKLHTMLETFERNLPMVTVTCGRCGNIGHGRRDCPL